REERDDGEKLHLWGTPASGERCPKMGARSRSQYSITASATKVTAYADPSPTERGRTQRASGITAPMTSVQPMRWCRNDERWKNQPFCSWTSNAVPETRSASTDVRRHHGLEIFPRTSASSVAPASISTCAHEPCATR